MFFQDLLHVFCRAFADDFADLFPAFCREFAGILQANPSSGNSGVRFSAATYTAAYAAEATREAAENAKAPLNRSLSPVKKTEWQIRQRSDTERLRHKGPAGIPGY